jgi:hypothetical protein
MAYVLSPSVVTPSRVQEDDAEVVQRVVNELLDRPYPFDARPWMGELWEELQSYELLCAAVPEKVEELKRFAIRLRNGEAKRRRRRRETQFPEQMPAKPESGNLTFELLDSLPIEHRRIARMVIEGRTQKEIAEELNTSQAWISKQLEAMRNGFPQQF